MSFISAFQRRFGSPAIISLHFQNQTCLRKVMLSRQQGNEWTGTWSVQRRTHFIQRSAVVVTIGYSDYFQPFYNISTIWNLNPFFWAWFVSSLSCHVREEVLHPPQRCSALRAAAASASAFVVYLVRLKTTLKLLRADKVSAFIFNLCGALIPNMEGGERDCDENGRWEPSTMAKIAERTPRNKIISSVQQELYKCAKQYKDKQTEILLTPGEVHGYPLLSL